MRATFIILIFVSVSVLAQTVFLPHRRSAFQSSVPPTETKPSTNNLVEFWEFTETLSGADETGAHAGYTLDANGAIISTVGVDGGVSRLFNGSSHYFDSNDTATGIRASTNNFTQMAFVRWSGTNISSTKAVWSVWETTSQRQLRVSFSADENFTVLPSTNGTAHLTSSNATTTITSNVWYFVAVRRNGSSFQTSVTQVGQPLASFGGDLDIGVEPLFSSSQDFRIATTFSGGAPQLYWDGRIDKPVFYNTNLTDAEVRWIYNESGGGTGRVYSAFLP